MPGEWQWLHHRQLHTANRKLNPIQSAGVLQSSLPAVLPVHPIIRRDVLPSGRTRHVKLDPVVAGVNQ